MKGQHWSAAAAVASVLLSSSLAHAEEVCVRTTGTDRPIRVRPSCRPNEQRLGSFDGFRRLLAVLTSEEAGETLRLTGVNLQIVSGSGATSGPVNGLGNLVVGYNEPGDLSTAADRRGSHNIVVGSEHRYRSYAGLVAGQQNELAAPYASVTAGLNNAVTARWASISGGGGGVASGEASSISAGGWGSAIGLGASVSGGEFNTATGDFASVTGGGFNVAGCGSPPCAVGNNATVTGGHRNVASSNGSSVLGGAMNRVESALYGVISGGQNNVVTA